MSFYKGKKVVVVGGSGFIGSHVVDCLLEQEADVAIVDNLSGGNYQPSNIIHYNLDITIEKSEKALETIFRNVDYVLNYAATPYIPDCINNPIKAIQTNTVGALRVIEAAREAKVTRILQVTSAEVYGNSQYYDEDVTALEAPSTYAASKVCADFLSRNRYVEVGAPVITLRQFNCIGERETHPYVVPEIINQIDNSPAEGTIKVRLGKNTKRDFMYVGDAAEIALELLEKGTLGEAYNLGAETSIEIYDLAYKIAGIMRYDQPIKVVTDESRFRPNDIDCLTSDNSKIHAVLGHFNTTSLEDALTLAIEDYKENGWNWERQHEKAN
jgi:nucleoside-diphosphate-sugar epimerase